MFPGVCIAIPHRRDNGKQFSSMDRSMLMEPRTLQYMVEASGGQCLRGAPANLVRRICSDSRLAQAQDLFVALRGERFDGHAYLDQVAQKGVAAALVEWSRIQGQLPDCALIAVDNSRAAFGRMAARYRQDFSLPIIAVAGSNGKTTTKNLLRSVLTKAFKTLSSPASFNNDIGVPTTLFELSQRHQVAVLEFGTNHPGELAALLAMAQPHFGVITSIGREHLEFFGNLDGVIREEGQLAEHLPSDGKLFLNSDIPGASEIARRSSAPVVHVGFGDHNQWRASAVRLDRSGTSFMVSSELRNFNRTFRVKLLGRHQVVNALLAIAVAAELGLPPEQVEAGLLDCEPAKMRLEPWLLDGAIQILDDSYNANADSMRAALETLRDLPCSGRRIAVLGDMAELGAHSLEAHAEIGRLAADVKVDRLIAVGQTAPVMAKAARAQGLAAVEEVEQPEAAAAALRAFLKPHDLVLVKASRSSGLERVGEILRQAPCQVKNHDQDQG